MSFSSSQKEDFWNEDQEIFVNNQKYTVDDPKRDILHVPHSAEVDKKTQILGIPMW